MPDLSEDVIRQITERVTREVLAALTDETTVPSVSDEWPDYDEYGNVGINPYPNETVAPPPNESPGPSLMRQMARGQVANAVVGFTEDGETIHPYTEGVVGDVLPIGIQTARAGGFDPNGNPEWFVAQRAKDAAQRRMPSWETVVRPA